LVASVKVFGSAKGGMSRRLFFHAPEPGGANDKRRGHHPGHNAVDDRVEVPVVEVDGKGAVADAFEDVAAIAWLR
jgi:hypothetical protein